MSISTRVSPRKQKVTASQANKELLALMNIEEEEKKRFDIKFEFLRLFAFVWEQEAILYKTEFSQRLDFGFIIREEKVDALVAKIELTMLMFLPVSFLLCTVIYVADAMQTHHTPHVDEQYWTQIYYLLSFLETILFASFFSFLR